MGIRRDGLEPSEEVLRRARRRALGGLVVAVALLPVVVALPVDWWLTAVLAVPLLMGAVQSLREYRHPDRTLQPALRDVLDRTLHRREVEAVPFPAAGSMPERILLLQDDLDLIEESLARMDGSSNTYLRRFTRHVIVGSTFFRGVILFYVVVSLLLALVAAIIGSAAGAALAALLMGTAALLGGIQWFIVRFKSRLSRAADILRGELATARRALSEDVGFDATDELRASQDSA